MKTRNVYLASLLCVVTVLPLMKLFGAILCGTCQGGHNFLRYNCERFNSGGSGAPCPTGNDPRCDNGFGNTTCHCTIEWLPPGVYCGAACVEDYVSYPPTVCEDVVGRHYGTVSLDGPCNSDCSCTIPAGTPVDDWDGGGCFGVACESGGGCSS